MLKPRVWKFIIFFCLSSVFSESGDTSATPANENSVCPHCRLKPRSGVWVDLGIGTGFPIASDKNIHTMGISHIRIGYSFGPLITIGYNFQNGTSFLRDRQNDKYISGTFSMTNHGIVILAFPFKNSRFLKNLGILTGYGISTIKYSYSGFYIYQTSPFQTNSTNLGLNSSNSDESKYLSLGYTGNLQLSSSFTLSIENGILIVPSTITPVIFYLSIGFVWF